jgi:inner membrane protein
MDNVTHTLTGLVLARAGLNRLGPRVTLLMILAANAPDIDIVAAPFGPLAYLEAHRGWTHCLLGLPFMAALSVAVAAAISRRKLPWLRMWLLACIGVASHLLLDWTNSYGIRLLLPFSSRWFSLDLNNLTDGLFLPALAIAAVWPWFSRLVGSEIGERRAARGQGSAIAALCFFVVLEFTRSLMHQRAVDQLNSRMYGGEDPTIAAALPAAVSPFQWRGIVETTRSYRDIDVNTLGSSDPQPGTVFYKRPFDPATLIARNTPAFRYFQYFARFPMWAIEPVTLPSGWATRVDLSDLRFGAPDAGSFHAIGLVNSENRVLLSVFTFGSGMNLGRGH